MKQLNIAYDDKDHKELVAIKNKSGLTWHDFILETARKWNTQQQ